MVVKLDYGEVQVSLKALKKLAYIATSQSYGPVNISSDSFFGKLFGEKEEERIKVEELDTGKVVVDLYIEVEYGVKVTEVAKNIIENVVHVLKNIGNCEDVEVNVHVTGIR
ncbi:Asp23/Gls24 family envelope stress response protein [Pseudothermotoga sp. U03pept]|uniref:Asp23/Gls24 family envelope stress response protein n=1 Tax=Pseudothermotoga sp. U03pept TaxID=3447012 RepID=UPI003F05B4E8